MKEILERNGFTFIGYCKVCSGQAELFKRDNIQCKIRPKAMRFELTVGGKTIKGRSSELESSLERYVPKFQSV